MRRRAGEQAGPGVPGSQSSRAKRPRVQHWGQGSLLEVGGPRIALGEKERNDHRSTGGCKGRAILTGTGQIPSQSCQKEESHEPHG